MAGTYLEYQQVLINWIVDAAGVPYTQVSWENEPRGFEVYPQFKLAGPEVSVIGKDWVTYDKSTPGSAKPIVHGVRAMIVQVRCVNQDQSAPQKAGNLLEKCRLALSLPHVNQAFNAAGLGFFNCTDIKLFDAKSTNSRMQSIASMTLRLTATPQALLSEVDVGTIESIEVTSHGLQPDLTGHLIPPA